LYKQRYERLRLRYAAACYEKRKSVDAAKAAKAAQETGGDAATATTGSTTQPNGASASGTGLTVNGNAGPSGGSSSLPTVVPTAGPSTTPTAPQQPDKGKGKSKSQTPAPPPPDDPTVLPWDASGPKPFSTFDDKEGYNEHFPSEKLVMKILDKLAKETQIERDGRDGAERFLQAAVSGARLTPPPEPEEEEYGSDGEIIPPGPKKRGKRKKDDDGDDAEGAEADPEAGPSTPKRRGRKPRKSVSDAGAGGSGGGGGEGGAGDVGGFNEQEHGVFVHMYENMKWKYDDRPEVWESRVAVWEAAREMRPDMVSRKTSQELRHHAGIIENRIPSTPSTPAPNPTAPIPPTPTNDSAPSYPGTGSHHKRGRGRPRGGFNKSRLVAEIASDGTPVPNVVWSRGRGGVSGEMQRQGGGGFRGAGGGGC
ncbi:hypothetical protein HDV00_008986, partial [Rhizophlyctis rosea]